MSIYMQMTLYSAVYNQRDGAGLVCNLEDAV